METKKSNFFSSYKSSLILLVSIIIGSVIGLVAGEKAMALRPLGQIFMNLMFTAVVPLVFVTVAGAIGNMANMRRLGKILKYMFLIFFVTAFIAAVIMFAIVYIFPPAEGVDIQLGVDEVEEADVAVEDFQKTTMADRIVSTLTVSDFSELLSKENMLPLIIFSVIFGICVSSVGSEDNIVAKLLDALSKVLMKYVEIIMLYAPIGLGAYFASLVGEFGSEILGAYGKTIAIYYPISFLYFFIAFPAYSYFAGGKEGLRRFFKNIFPPAVTAFTTGSSLATLPVSLDASKKMGVPKDIREIVVSVGTTMQMDGVCLSSILKIAFLFGIFGQDFTGIGTFITAMLVSVAGGVVMGSIPGGGFIGEMLIVNLYGFPPEAFPLIATIGILVDPPSTMINAGGDSVSAMMVTRMVEGKDWINKDYTSEEANEENIESK